MHPIDFRFHIKKIATLEGDSAALKWVEDSLSDLCDTMYNMGIDDYISEWQSRSSERY
jgi:hypothetical protein